YFITFSNFFIILFLAQLPLHTLPPQWRRMDQWLGHLSYPMFLLHFPVALALHWKVFPQVEPLTFSAMMLAFPFILLAAWIMHRGIERPIQSLRGRIRPDSTP